MREAQALCARLRAECDVLKGMPKSTRDDPNFMETYFKYVHQAVHLVPQAVHLVLQAVRMPILEAVTNPGRTFHSQAAGRPVHLHCGCSAGLTATIMMLSWACHDMAKLTTQIVVCLHHVIRFCDFFNMFSARSAVFWKLVDSCANAPFPHKHKYTAHVG